MPGLGIISKGWKTGKSIATGGWKTAGFLGTHTKGAFVGAGMLYGGWKYMSTGHLPGEDIMKKVGNGISNTMDVVNRGLEATSTTLGYVNDGLERAPELIQDTREALSGVGSTVTNVVGGVTGGGQGGQGGGRLSNLFGGVSNLLGGLFNGGIGSMLGLVASAFMLFGGFGWMGKIGGLLLGALSLGLFKGNSQPQQQAVQQAPVAQIQPREAGIPTPIDMGTEEGGYTVHRSR